VAYRFSQRGYSPPEEVPTDRKVVLIQREVREPVAHILPVPGTFCFMTTFVTGQEAMSPMVISAALDNGLQEIEVNVARNSLRYYKDLVEEVENSFSCNAYEVPIWHAIWHAARRFFEMAEFWKGQRSHPEVEQAKKLLQPFHDPEKPPYGYEIMPVLNNPQEHLNDIDERDLFEKMDFSPLVFSKEILAPFWRKMQDADQSVLVVSQDIKHERAARILEQATNELFGGENGSFYQRFFEEEALRLKLSGSDEAAMSAWITAQYIRAGLEASGNPVLFQIVLGSLYGHWQEDIEESEQTKAEDLPGKFRRTDSGLIIPK
jgi:hypothetical protein